MEWPNRDALVERALLNGQPTPPDPDLDPGLMPIWRAWHRLSLDRNWISAGMGGSVPGNVPFLALIKWCEIHGLSRDEMIFYDKAMVAMDGVYRAWYAAKSKPEDK